MWLTHQYDLFRDFPGGSVLKNSPSSAGEVGFDPCQGEIPHGCGARKAKLLLLSLCPLEPTAVTADPACHSEELMCCN